MINVEKLDKQSSIYKYATVCDAPGGVGFQIEHMPEFFEYDTDNHIPHVHAFYEIIWFQEEGGTHTVDFQTYPIKKNSLFFLSPGQVHHFDGSSRHKGVLLKFCTDFLREEKAQEDIFIKYNVFNSYDTVPYCTIPDSNVAEHLASFVKMMEEELEIGNSFGHLDMIRSLVKIFLVTVHRHGVKEGLTQLSTAKASHRLFIQFRRLLEQEYDELHTVKEYADRLNVSTKTLSNSVQECSGKAPLTYINNRIILEAKRLLKFTSLMVKEVAYQLGYEDPSYFVKFFKRETGYLPTDFKEEDVGQKT
jgi:AraC-like DNA-binding protein